MKQNKKVLIYFICTWLFLFLLFQYGPKQRFAPFRSNEVHLFQGNTSQDLLFIESPDLDLKPYQVKLYPFLPPLYSDLPSSVPYQIKVYLEKRNQYLHQFAQSFISQEQYSEGPFLPPFHQIQDIREILPCTYNQREAIAIISDQVILLDQSLELLSFPSDIQGTYDYHYHGHILSAFFPDRFWKQYSIGGSGGIKAYLQKIQIKPGIEVSEALLIGDTTSANIPFKSLKAIKLSSDPQVVFESQSLVDNIIYTGILTLWVMVMWWLIQITQKRFQKLVKIN
jgi:hypothetical protein